MDTRIKAIQTKYKGRLFRSRLEARWAVFFDKAKIEWQYEPEGYDLDGMWYLPDFYSPSAESFFEIKPIKPNEREIEVGNRLEAVTGKDYFILVGEPKPSIIPELGITAVEVFSLSGHGWICQCRRCEGVCLVTAGSEYDWIGYGDLGNHVCGDHDRWPISFRESTFESALSARFGR